MRGFGKKCAQRSRLNRTRFFHAASAAAPRCAAMTEMLERRQLLSSASVAAGVLTYTATPAEVNELSISVSGANYIIKDSSAVVIVAGAGVSGGGAPGAGASTPVAGITQIVVSLGDQNDTGVVSVSGIPVAMNGNDGNDTLTGGATNDVLDGGAGSDTFIGNGGTDNIGGGAGSSVGDTILVGGTSGADVISLAANASGHVVATINGLATTYTNFLGGALSTSGIEEILVDGQSGKDGLTVDSTSGAIPVPITYDGGANNDLLTLTGGTATASTYNPGPGGGDGEHSLVIGGVTQTVSFTGLEPVVDLVTGPLVVNASNADNAINYSQGSVAANGLVSIDNFETIEFSNKSSLTINALAGSDTINLNNPTTPAGLTGITIAGGDPTASDTLVVNGIAGSLDNLRYLPSAAGAGTVVNDDAPQPNVNFSRVEHLTLVVQQADGDGIRMEGTDGNDAIEFSHGATSDKGSFVGTMDQNNITGSGPFTATPMSYSGISPLANDSDVNFFNPGGTDTLVFNGTGSDDNIQITGGEAGGAQFSNTLGGILMSRLEVFNVASALVRVGEGNDTINVNVPAGPSATTIRVEGGDSDAFSDTLNYTAPTGAATTINYGTASITSTGPAGNPLTFSGIELINSTSSGAGSTMTVAGTTGSDVMVVTPTSATGAKVELISSDPSISGRPVINATGVGSTFTVDPVAAANTVNELIFNATASNDTLNLSRNPGALTLERVGTKVITTTAAFFSWTVNAGDGGDSINLTDGNPVQLVHLNINGGGGTDTLNNLTAASTTYKPGSDNDAGSLTRGGLLTDFTGIDAVNVVLSTAVGTTGTIDAGSGANQITVTGTGATSVVTTVDNHSPVSFSGATLTTLNVQAGAGDDAVAVTAGPLGSAVTINVDGGAPAASDTLTVNGSAGVLDNLRYQPTKVGEGSVVNDDAPQATVNFTNTEKLTLVVQQADGDGVRVEGTTGNDAIEFSHGATSDSGSFVGTMDQNNATTFGPFTMTPMNLSGASPLANDGDVNFFNPGGTDSIAFNGTGGNDTISVGGGEAGGIEFRNTVNGIVVSRLEVFNVANALVRGGDGDDVFNQSGINVPVTYEGGAPSASDVLNYTGTGGALALSLLGKVVSETGFSPVFYNGVESVNLNGGGAALTVYGSAVNDTITYKPTGTNAGFVAAAGAPAAALFTNVLGAFTIDPLGGTDNVQILGTIGADTFNALLNPTATVQVNALKTVRLPSARVELISFYGGQGGDTFNVTAYAGTSMKLFVDGGQPTGSSQAGDILKLIAGSPGYSATNKTNGSFSGTATATYAGSSVRVDYTSVEKVIK